MTEESVKKLKTEMDEMRKTIARLSASKESTSEEKQKQEYALGFDPNEYLSKGFIESANWIAETIAVRMKARMNESEDKWKVFKMVKEPDMRSLVTCVTYNRGEFCRQGSWHTVLKRNPLEPTGAERFGRRDIDLGTNREELRVHACTLCWKALGVLSMHGVMNCPWIIEDNWK